MRKKAFTLVIVLILTTVAAPTLATDRYDHEATGLRAAFAWILDLVGYGDTERAVPEARQRVGLEIIVDGSTPPPDNGDEISEPGTEIGG